MAIKSIRQLAEALYNIAIDKRGSALEEIIDRAVSILREKGIFSKRQELLDELQRIHLDREGRLKAVVTSKEALSHSVRTGLVQHLKHHFKKDIELEEIVDVELLGGFQIRVGDHLFDATLDTQIKKLTTHLAA